MCGPVSGVSPTRAGSDLRFCRLHNRTCFRFWGPHPIQFAAAGKTRPELMRALRKRGSSVRSSEAKLYGARSVQLLIEREAGDVTKAASFNAGYEWQASQMEAAEQRRYTGSSSPSHPRRIIPVLALSARAHTPTNPDRSTGSLGSACEKTTRTQQQVHSSRSRIIGSTASAFCAGIHAAASPSTSIVSTTPPNTSGSFGDA